jgi:MoaA/NifB/PqqE/SkfB family radical SAM enzyme
MLFKRRSKSFCIVPWTQVATNASGNYRVCCNSTPGKNFLFDAEGKPMKIFKHSIDEVWNSPGYIELREQFLRGERPEICQRCFREEDSGVKSARQSNNQSWSSKHESKSTIPVDVKYIDIRLGNLCNLKCRMCNPYASSKWVDSWNQIVETASLVPNQALEESEVKRLKRLDWPANPETWKNLKPILSSLEEIYLTGGEPFLSLQQVQFLKFLIDEGHSKTITLKYNTNLTLLPVELVSLWSSFKTVRLNVSMDGIGQLDEYIRFPTKWETVENNLKKIIQYQQNGYPIKLGVHTTVQMYNVLALDSIITHLKEFYHIEPYLNILNHPHCLNVRTLPSDLKRRVHERLAPLKNFSNATKVLSYMDKEDWSGQYFEEFKGYTKALDRMNAQNLFDVVPEFEEFFDGTNH